MKFRIHPLFVIYSLWLVVRGDSALFAAYTVSLILHEIGHANVARRLGYQLDTITLMPYGARASGNIDGIKPSSEIKIAIAGPAVNLMLALPFVALWWLAPESYAFTLTFVQANLAVCLFNLLPVLPLDGGRVLSAALSSAFPLKNTGKILRNISLAFSLALSVFAASMIFAGGSLNYIFMAIFISMSAVMSIPSGTYYKLLEKTYRSAAIKKGMSVRFTAVSASAPGETLLALTSPKHYNVFIVMDDNLRETGRLTETELDAAMSGKSGQNAGELCRAKYGGI